MRPVRFPRRGFAPLSPRSSVAARVCVVGLAAVASGCATQQPPSYAGVANPHVRPVTERPWKVEIEEDGKPAQLPPVRRMRPEEDDPSQPWSPNYGRGSSTSPPATAPVEPRTAWPKPIATTLRTASTPRALADADADALIARAVNAHELRRP
jgi:hypothetical protein